MTQASPCALSDQCEPGPHRFPRYRRTAFSSWSASQTTRRDAVGTERIVRRLILRDGGPTAATRPGGRTGGYVFATLPAFHTGAGPAFTPFPGRPIPWLKS